MFDTYVTIVGNVLTAPEWRRTTQSNTLVANFKVASTARRLDRDSGRWVDGNSLRVRVNCWRKLAEGVAASVMVGDPVVVCGRLYTRDWTDDAGNHRSLYELEAVAVGHDLSRGRSRFQRNRPTMTTSTVEDTEAEHRVHGEATEPVPDEDAPVLPDRRPLDDDFEPDFGAYPAGRALPTDAAVDGSLDPFDDPADGPHDEEPDGPELENGREPGESRGSGDGRGSEEGRGPGGHAPDTDGPSPEAGGPTPVTGLSQDAPGARGDRRDLAAGEPGPAFEEVGAGVSPTGRGRRGRGRAPQPA
ncbi:single-stranded DNA-binding protein [Micromonospora sp. NPDC023633]|uniref:single-stranded DNA-binding protein n=1 Tax=Micromonospora sp. NPDC023633 TaxID=3154320 RepID=UPI0033FD7916